MAEQMNSELQCN